MTNKHLLWPRWKVEIWRNRPWSYSLPFRVTLVTTVIMTMWTSPFHKAKAKTNLVVQIRVLNIANGELGRVISGFWPQRCNLNSILIKYTFWWHQIKYDVSILEPCEINLKCCVILHSRAFQMCALFGIHLVKITHTLKDNLKSHWKHSTWLGNLIFGYNLGVQKCRSTMYYGI